MGSPWFRVVPSETICKYTKFAEKIEQLSRHSDYGYDHFFDKKKLFQDSSRFFMIEISFFSLTVSLSIGKNTQKNGLPLYLYCIIFISFSASSWRLFESL